MKKELVRILPMVLGLFLTLFFLIRHSDSVDFRYLPGYWYGSNEYTSVLLAFGIVWCFSWSWVKKQRMTRLSITVLVLATAAATYATNKPGYKIQSEFIIAIEFFCILILFEIFMIYFLHKRIDVKSKLLSPKAPNGPQKT